MRVLRQNLVDLSTTTITATTENVDLPVANIAHPHRGKVYRSGVTVAAETILIDLGSAMAVQSVVLLDHTLTSGDSAIKLQGGATVGATTVNETLTFNADTIAKFLSVAQTYRYWQIIFTKSAADEYRDFGRVFLGPYDEYTLGPAQPGGLSITPVDLSVTGRALGGQTYSAIREQYNDIEIEFPGAVSETQSAQMLALASACGTHTPFFVSIDPTNKPYAWLFYVKARSLQAQTVNVKKGATILWNASMKLAEEI